MFLMVTVAAAVVIVVLMDRPRIGIFRGRQIEGRFKKGRQFDRGRGGRAQQLIV